MAKKVLVNLDLSKNQVLNIALHNLASAPAAPVVGQMYYNTTDNVIYFWNGTTWLSVAGDIQEVIAGAGLIGGGSSGSVTLDINPDNSTIEISGDAVRIKDLGVTTAKLADSAVTTAKILDSNVTTAKINDLAVTTGKINDLAVTTGKINDLAVTTGKIADSGVTTAKIADSNVTTLKLADANVTFAKIQNIATMTVIGRVAAGSGVASEIAVINDATMASASATNIPTAGSIKSYVDNRIASLGNLEGGFAAGSSANFPAAAGGTKAGDYWYVTSAGTVQGVILNIGDVLIAAIDAASPTDASNWIFVESNRDQATETVKGVAEIATQSETNAGTDDERIVTPLKLKTLLDARVGGFAANIGNGSATSYALSHGLATIDVIVMLKDNTTLEEVFADITITDANTVTVAFALAPATNAYRVIIKK